MKLRTVLYLTFCITQISAAIAAVITNVDDFGPGSLRAAIESATPGEILTFDPALSGQTIILTSGELRIRTNLTVDGSGLPRGVTIDGGGQSRIFNIDPGAVVSLETLTISNGLTNDFRNIGGGAILNSGDLTINNSTLLGNRALSGSGGAIRSGSMLTINNSTITANSSAFSGGAISFFGRLFINSSTITENLAGNGLGGIDDVSAETATVINSIVTRNRGSKPEQLSLPISEDSRNNLFSGDPFLAPLGNYGGPTATRPPLPGSPAIDAGGATALVTDQRGGARVVDGSIDIGAVETGAIPGSIPSLLESPIVTVAGDELDTRPPIALDDLSLREAITFAAPGSVITFSPSLSDSRITLSSAPIELPRSVTIRGISPGIEIASEGGGMLQVGLDASVHIQDLKFIGLGIENEGELMLERCLIEDSTSSGITSNGNLTIAETIISNVQSDGVVNNGGILTMSDSEIVQNGANGITSTMGSVTTIEASFISENGIDGVSIVNGSIRNSTISKNSGVGVVNLGSGSLFIESSTIATNSGGGITSSGTLTIENSTIAANSAISGGGIFTTGSLNLNATTIAFNSAQVGGGIFSRSGTLTLNNTIVAGNFAPTDLESMLPLSSESVNNLISGDPLLAPLGDYGGPTLTTPPMLGSQAIDAGGVSSFDTDQRGSPRVAGVSVDIGAVEVSTTDESIPIPLDAPVVTTLADFPNGESPFDPSNLSLRDAITLAAAGGTVRFSPALSGQKLILSGEPIYVIRPEISFDGSLLSRPLTLDGDRSSRIFIVREGTALQLDSLIIANGFSGDDGLGGGAILNFGELAINNCKLVNNQARSGTDGGAISNLGMLTIIGSEISANRSTQVSDGSGRGGGISNEATLVMERSIIRKNSSSGDGGGLCSKAFATATLKDVDVSNNTALSDGGGISISGSESRLDLTGCNIRENDASRGGGIYSAITRSLSVRFGEIEIRRCAFVGNTATNFAGLFCQDASLEIYNSTFALNAASNNAGGISRGRPLTSAGANVAFIIENSTVTNNSAGNMYGGLQSDDLPVLIRNSIVAGNTAQLSQDSNAAFAPGSSNNLVSVDPFLEPLGYYGGGVLSMRPTTESPVIDAGTEVSLETDQRGLPRISGASPDIGAVELQEATVETAFIFEIDTDGDGLPSGLELAVGRDPIRRETSLSAPLSIDRIDGRTRIDFRIAPSVSESIYLRLTASSDLVDFSEVVLSNEVVPFTPEEGNQIRVIEDLSTDRMKFYRLEAILR